MKIELVKQKEFWTRQQVQNDPYTIYLFGDNLIGHGNADRVHCIRGLINAVGIPTKKLPTMSENAFFTDDEYEDNCYAIEQAFAKIPLVASMLHIADNPSVKVVMSADGLGTGLSQLPERAPHTYEHLLAITALLPNRFWTNKDVK